MPGSAEAVGRRSPGCVVLPALTAGAYGSRLTFDGQTFTVQATHLMARAALGATSRAILVPDIRALQLSTPNGVRSGTLSVGTATGKTLVRYGGRHAGRVTAIYDALAGAVTCELITVARTFTGLSPRQAEKDGFILGSDERLYGIVEDAELMELRRAGGHSPTIVDEGRAAMTNKRIIFTSPRQSREWVLADLIDIDHAADGRWTALNATGRQMTSGLGYPATAAEDVRFRIRLALADFQGAREALAVSLEATLRD